MSADGQKLCAYCSSPAPRMAEKCKTCGSALPAAGPLAKVLELPKYWSLRKAGFISAGATTGLSLLSNYQVIGQITLAWVFLFVPYIMVIAAWRHAQFDMGTWLGNAFIALGVWVLCLLLWLNFSGFYHGTII